MIASRTAAAPSTPPMGARFPVILGRHFCQPRGGALAKAADFARSSARRAMAARTRSIIPSTNSAMAIAYNVTSTWPSLLIGSRNSQNIGMLR